MLVFTFVLLLVSAYQQYQLSAAAARLSDATSMISTRLAVEELAYVDGSGETHVYVIDPARLDVLENFRHEIGEELYEFNVSRLYKAGEERVIGPRGPPQPENKINSSLVIAVALFENGRYLPAKLKVITWR